MGSRHSKNRTAFLIGASALAMSVLLMSGTDSAFSSLTGSQAFAQDHAESEGGKGKGPKAGGDDHSHEDGETTDHDHTDSESDDHDHTDGGSGKGPKAGGDDHGSGQGEGSGGKGEGSGGAGKGSSGERPVWAKEGIPEVELGRMNVARSPSHVLDRAYAEALSNFTAEEAAFYSLPMNDALEKLRTAFRDQAIIDSPLQNLALLRDALDGTSILSTKVTNTNANLMALFLGTASDKTVPIVAESAYAIAKILGFELTQAAAAKLANDAEQVRQAVFEGHG